MKLNYSQVRRDNVIKISAGLSILLLITLTILIIFVQNSLPPYVPLLNNVPWGTERLVGKSILYFIPVLAALMVVISAVMVGTMYEKNTLMARILSFNIFLMMTLALLALLQIILLVL